MPLKNQNATCPYWVVGHPILAIRDGWATPRDSLKVAETTPKGQKGMTWPPIIFLILFLWFIFFNYFKTCGIFFLVTHDNMLVWANKMW